jgi:2-polyprenyl-3-methyl-5-hydroxy-6-metoxy-1,4-benzoquinol methylase
MNDKIPCPGCGDNNQQPLEKINLAEQHRHYAPDDKVTRERLTAEAQKAAPSYNILRCTKCELEFASPMRSPPASWYALAYQALPLYPQTRWEFHACLRRFSRSDSVFEFGCGSGAFLQLCAKKGIPVVGVDFFDSAVEDCRREGLEAHLFDMSSSLPDNFNATASQIVAFHLLEHLENPRRLFEQATQVAKPGAHLWVAVPSAMRMSRRRGLVDVLDQPPHHMTRWTRSALEQIGSATGWRLVEFEGQPLPLPAALWSITTSSVWYRKWRSEGRLNNPFIERALRFINYPSAMINRMTNERNLTGFSMLACYSRIQT